jgi:dolichol-phosphate mannosyltransferase
MTTRPQRHDSPPARGAPELTIVMPALHEAANLVVLLPALRSLLAGLDVSHEILVDSRPDDRETESVAAAHGARFLGQREPGYGGALVEGFAAACGDYVLTMDADVSHASAFVEHLWNGRRDAEVTIASRYVDGGSADMPPARKVLSRALNWFFGIGLSVPIRDLSSGFRLYKRSVLAKLEYRGRDFDILQEIVVRAYAEGWTVREIPFRYAPRRQGQSHARVLRVGRACLRTFGRLWRLRNSILAADYDDRAHDSRIPLQRYWQRRRFHHVTTLVSGEGPVLDVGCGSSRIISALPRGSVAVDVLLRKLRYARRFGVPLVQASGFALPFADRSFTCVLCSQVIEHVPKASPIIDELCRVLAPGGRLVLGTPDYGRWQWVYIEKAYAMVPGGYADEHIAHYDYDELVRLTGARGLVLEESRYILRGELIMAFRKPPDMAYEDA